MQNNARYDTQTAARGGSCSPMAKMGSFRAHPGRDGAKGEPRSPELRAPGRIYRVIIVILVIDYPRTISAATWLCTPAGVSIYSVM